MVGVKARVIFSHWIEPEDDSPERAFSFKETGVDHGRLVEWIHEELDRGNQAAWCFAVVTASVEFIANERDLSEGGRIVTGRATLGGCSYPSETRLWADNLDDLEHEAKAELFDQIRASASRAPKADAEYMLVVLDRLLEEYGP